MHRLGTVAIVDLLDELTYFNIKYTLRIDIIQDIIEYLVLCKINALVTNLANDRHGLSDVMLDSAVFYLEDIELLASDMDLDISNKKLIDLLGHLDHIVNEIKLSPFWDILAEQSLDINNYSIRWFKSDLQVRVGG